ncbi:hypothetical protein AAG570_003659 [Ranatra chinensis]|uniref:Uncharacterized protein n=1 Tax=Ranatra chinensis TaxID=642074 RepID=A0ABD0Y6J1_9HEMI
MVSDNEEETIYVRKKSRKALMIVDDPEDDEEQESNVVGDKGPGIDNNSDGSEGITSQISSTVSKVVSASNSSDEGNESGSESNKEKPSESKKKARRIVAMTDSDEESGDSESGKKEPLSSHKFDNDIYDAEDSSDGEDLKTNDQDVSLSGNEDSEAAKNPKLLADSDIYDAEGSSDEDSRVVGTEDNKMSEQSKQKSKKSSKSKKKGNNKDVPNSDEVHIEAQRMLRQSRVRLPYHTPRQRSLHQFLHRRSLPPLPLVRTSAQQIKHLWEQLEEKEKEAEILYKSESECEDELDGNSVEQLPPPEKQVTFEAVEIEQSDSVPVQQPEEEEAPSAQADTHSTENLDASNGGSDGKNEPPKAEEVEVVMPKIKPPPGEVIELFLEDEPKCGDTPVDSFIKRFTKHVAINSKVKEEKQVDISVLSAEYNSTGEVVKLCEETLSVKCGGGNNTGGGGARMAALKASLKQAMAQDRHQRLERNKMNYQLDEEKFEDEFNLDDEELELSDKEGSIKGNCKEDCDDNGAGSESDEEVEEDLENYPTKEKKKDEYSKMFLEDEAEESDAEEGDGDNDRAEEDGSDSSGKEGSGSEEDNDDDNGSGKDTDTVDSSAEQVFNLCLIACSISD